MKARDMGGKKANKGFFLDALFLENLKRNGDSRGSSGLREMVSERPCDFLDCLAAGLLVSGACRMLQGQEIKNRRELGGKN